MGLPNRLSVPDAVLFHPSCRNLRMNKKLKISCVECKTSLTAPASAAGKTTKCPKCGAAIRFSKNTATAAPPRKPKPTQKRDAIPDPFGLDDEDANDPDAESPSDELTDAFPADDTFVKKRANRDVESGRKLPPKRKRRKKSGKPKLRDGHNAYAPPSIESTTGRAKESEELTVWDIALCVSCGLLGLVMGVLRITSGNETNGRKMVKLSFASLGIMSVLGVIAEVIRSFSGE